MKLQAGVNDLATVNPKLAAQAHGFDPRTVTEFSTKTAGWKCEFDHIWDAKVSDRSRGRGCPYCAGQKVLAGYNDLATVDPDLAKQAQGFDPRTVTKSSGRKVDWKCKRGHVWEAEIKSRSSGKGCPYCANQKVLAGYNDLATVDPLLAAQVHGWDPTTVTKFCNRKASWRCTDGHVWQAVIKSRSEGNGCPYCANQKVLAGYNDLVTVDPDLAAQAHGWDPTIVTKFSGKKRDWQCEKGHVWESAINNRFSGNGCPYCANKKVLAGYNDLATVDPDLAAQAHGWDPTTVTRFCNRKVSWRCLEDHVWDAVIYSRSQGRGCSICAEHGFNTGKAGHVYFIEHQELDLFQIGISNDIKTRLSTHARSGWQVINVSLAMPGDRALSYEQDGLRLLRHLGARFANKIGLTKFDGYTEAWTRDSLQISGIAELISMVDEARHEALAS